ncbi:MAG TPA: D-2-hydroxyacid dehydrogenase [bacterium]|nr:D-2-hydroxyacid dehydrogenase [bacterium]
MRISGLSIPDLISPRKHSIVFLDAGTVDFGDVSFAEIRQLGHVEVYRDTPSGKIEERVRQADTVIVNKCVFDRRLLTRLKAVRAIHVAATGVNNVDLKAAKEKGIAVTNVTGYSTETMAQAVFALLLAMACDLFRMSRTAKDGTWSRSPFFMVTPVSVKEIYGKTLGILGYGNIGKKVAKTARAFGMKVIVGRVPGMRYPGKDKVNRVDFKTLIRRSDFLTLHAPLTENTRNLINGRVIRKMKHGSFLINTARGGIVDERALDRALRSGHLAGAAVDVLSQEPPPARHFLFKTPNLILTPHSLWASLEVRKRLIHELALNIKAFQRGRRRNRLV